MSKRGLVGKWPPTHGWTARRRRADGEFARAMGRVSVLALSLLALHSCSGTGQAQDDLDILRSRFVASMVPTAGSPGARLAAEAARDVAASLTATGCWPDINYTTVGAEGRSWWITGTHLQRTIVLATAANHNPDYVAIASKALRFWLEHDFTNSNWWWQWIGTPRAVAKALLLLPTSVSAPVLPLAMPIVDRSNYSHPGNPNEATNLVWMAGTRALVGTLVGDSEQVTEAYRRIESTVVINAFDEGLQVDGSYHQHGPQLYSGWGYGAIWTMQMLFFGSMVEGTKWKFSYNASLGVSKMIIDGQRWMTAGPNFDYTTSGRLMTYFANSSGPGGLNHGHYHYYAAFVSWSQSFPNFHSMTLAPPKLTPLAVMFELNTSWVRQLPNTSLIGEFATQLDTPGGGISAAIGHRHFWKSDYSVLRRGASVTQPLSSSFMVSVRMVSSRTISTECGNEEGKQGENLADGVTTVYVTGREFEDIFPVWDWRLLPGTIEVQVPNPSPPSCTDVMDDREHLERSDFVGGVSDGTIGCAVMDYHPRGQMQVHRSWFMLDRVVVVTNIGTNASLADFSRIAPAQGCSDTCFISWAGHTTGPTAATIATAWDQRLLSSESPALFSTRTSTPCNKSGRAPYFSRPEPIQPGVVEQRLQNLAYLHHSKIGFVPLPTPTMVAHCAPQPEWSVTARTSNRTGSWANITQGDANLINKPVFSAHIDHGKTDDRADISTIYAILPGINSEAMPAAMEELDQHLSVDPGWNVSSLCFNALAQPSFLHATVDGSATSRRTNGSGIFESWQGKTSDFLAPDIHGTTMMASFWQTGEASMQHQGCWDVALSAFDDGNSSEVAMVRSDGADRCMGASQPQEGMHCDLENSRALHALKVKNYSACLVACCENEQCDCWTWTPDERGTGPECMIKQSRSPLQLAPGLWGGNNPTRAAARPTAPKGVVVILREEIVSKENLDLSKRVSPGDVLLHVSVSDPTAKLKSVTLKIAGQWKGDCAHVAKLTNASAIRVVFPTGPDAGKTISFTCHS